MAKKQSPVKIIKTQLNDDHLGQSVQIKCTGADLVPIDQFTDFQGKLKKLSEESYQRLKQSILSLGFSFPVAAWKYRNKNMVLDAHQRLATLRRMQEEGYIVPPLPVIWVEAKDQQEAARKVLAATSQFGEIQQDGLHNFMQEFKLEMPDVVSSFKFPEVDFDSFKAKFFDTPMSPTVIGEGFSADSLNRSSSNQNVINPTRELRNSGQELDLNSFNNFDCKCPKCGFEFNNK